MTIDGLVYGYVASEETYQDKAVIIEEGSKGDWVYVILKGSAKVRKRTRKGAVTLDTLGEGDIFGDLWLRKYTDAVGFQVTQRSGHGQPWSTCA